MAILGTRNAPTRPSTKKNPPRNMPEVDTPVLITGVAKATNVMTLTFNVPVRLDGTPAFTTNLAGVTAVSAVLTAPNAVAITFSAAITTATALFIGYRDPAIRGASGGYVSSTQFPV
jgi:hypothetical protein